MLEQLRARIRKSLLANKDVLLKKDELKREQLRKTIEYIVRDAASLERYKLDTPTLNRLVEEILSELISLGPLQDLIEDDAVTEIMVNGPHKIYVERRGEMMLTDIKFRDEAHLLHTIEKLIAPSGRRVDESSPYVDFSLPDGSRVNIIIPPVSLVGPVITIRKFSPDIAKTEDLLRFKTLDKRMADFLVASIKAKLNIVFSGATGVGKTTTLNVLSSYISDQERIISIEDTAELNLRQEHVVRLESKPSNIEGKGEVQIRDLFRNSLRMRPDRIILGEIRGTEALDLIQAISSGHAGSLAVIHSSSPPDCVYRMEMMMLMSGIALSPWVIKKNIANAIDIIVQMVQFDDGSRKITAITEVHDIEGAEEIELVDLFVFDHQGYDENGKVLGTFKACGKIPEAMERFKLLKLNIDPAMFQEG
jgi:pilus assembly protein CpaF